MSKAILQQRTGDEGEPGNVDHSDHQVESFVQLRRGNELAQESTLALSAEALNNIFPAVEIRRCHKLAPSVRPSAILKGDFECNRDISTTDRLA